MKRPNLVGARAIAEDTSKLDAARHAAAKALVYLREDTPYLHKLIAELTDYIDELENTIICESFDVIKDGGKPHYLHPCSLCGYGYGHHAPGNNACLTYFVEDPHVAHYFHETNTFTPAE